MIILVLLLCAFRLPLYAQERLSEMPIPVRDSMLVDIAQRVLKNKYPKQYRKDGINPFIERCVFEHEASYYKNNPTPVPKYVEKGDVFYRVTLNYDKANEEHFDYFYTACVTILEKNKKPIYIHLGEFNLGYSLLDEDEKQK